MKFKSIAALAVASLAFAAPAGAALVSFSQGDLLMGFHATGGTGAGQTYVVDLGSAAGFRDATGNVTLNLGNIGADLTSLYGANWSTRSDILWGIAGNPSNVAAVGSDPEDTLYASRAENNGTPAGGFTVASSANRGSTATRVQSLIGSFQTYQSTSNSAVAVIQGDNDTNSWRSFMNGGTAVNTPGGIDLGAFSDIEGTPSQSLSLYRITNNQPGTYEGSFGIGSNGTVTFTAVPEAASSLLVGAGALLLAVRRRRNA